MQNIYIDLVTADKWRRIAAALKRASDAIAEAQLIMLLELDGDIRPLAIINNAADALNGQAYMFTPQTEWTGGETSKIRLPHVVLMKDLSK